MTDVLHIAKISTVEVNVSVIKENLIFPLFHARVTLISPLFTSVSYWSAPLLKAVHIQNNARVPLQIDGQDAIAAEVNGNRSYMYVRNIIM